MIGGDNSPRGQTDSVLRPQPTRVEVRRTRASPDLVQVPSSSHPRVVVSDVDPGKWTEFLRNVHIEDIGAAAFELARVEPYLATGLVAVLTPVEGDEDTS